jgi:hypothetical protein
LMDRADVERPGRFWRLLRHSHTPLEFVTGAASQATVGSRGADVAVKRR